MDYNLILRKAIAIHEEIMRSHGALVCKCFEQKFGEWIRQYEKEQNLPSEKEIVLETAEEKAIEEITTSDEKLTRKKK